MRKRLWIAATMLTALALLGTAAGAANSGADLTSLDPEGVVASITSNVATNVAAQASEHGTQANENDEDNETEADEDDDNPQISPSTEASPSGTTSTKPGWGCGDTNHEHSGPPGRPDASPPPGCDHAGSGGQSGSAGQSGNAGNSADHRNANSGASNPGKGKGH